MKKGLVFLLLLIAGIARCQTGVSLAGKVADSTSNKPLSNCSVYLNNTSIGTVTSEDGTFLLKNIPRGRADLIISAKCPLSVMSYGSTGWKEGKRPIWAPCIILFKAFIGTSCPNKGFCWNIGYG